MSGKQRLSEAALGERLTREELLLRAAAAGVAVGAGGLLSAESAAGAFAATPKRGGTLRVGISGGSTKDSLDAHNPIGAPDIARVPQLYEALAKFDENFRLKLLLAEEITPERADRWLVRIKPGIEFHDGKTLTADDVIFSLRRILNPKIPAEGRAGLTTIDAKRIKKLDSRTIRLFLKQPNVTLPDELAQYWNGIVPIGYDPKKPVGTGPFMFKSFTPGRESVFDRNTNYWRKGRPYIDSLVIIDFAEDTARVNALVSGQVHAIDSVPFAQVRLLKRRRDVRLLISPGGQWVPFTMRVDAEPFRDNRVRQAFRLIVDRQQIVRQALAGLGRVGNDLFAPFDPCFTSSLPQRRQDIERARFLLKQAGKEGLTIELVTSTAVAGMLEAAQIFAPQAAKAGVTVKLRNVEGGVFYGPNYLKWVFSQDFWNTRNYLPQVSQGMLPTSPFNETHWPDPESRRYVRLYRSALATVDEKKRCELIHEMQRMEWERGGLIISHFNDYVDAHSPKITGLRRDRGTLRLNRYGFQHVWFV